MNKFGFRLVKTFEVPELNTSGKLFEHDKTGARLLSLENDDENKVFGITFRTPPPDSTGLPHIMEHSVLCGSRKYPVKEPFVELMKGSLNTFLNAFTFPDRTCYPIASQNLQDFYNLVDVYLDAVFYPLIPPDTLKQEGWHYELENSESPLEYKGVVFNEMKGAYSSPDGLLYKHTQQSLFPDHVYGLDSGGDPRVIPSLTYEKFKQFHEKYYHPSNAYIFFYGDGETDKRLEVVSEYLEDFNRIEVGSSIPLKESFTAPIRLEFGFDPGEGDENKKNSQLVVNWVIAETSDRDLYLALGVLEHILVGISASPLRKALIDSGLGDDLAGFGLEDDLRQLIFSTGLKGIAEEDAGKVEALVIETLNKLASEGIEDDMIAAALNTIEFRLRENNTGSFPRGLSLMLRALRTWIYDGDPVEMLAFESSLATLKKNVEENRRYFEQLIEKYFIKNTHRTTITLKPEPGLMEKIDRDEKEKLAAVKEQMSAQDILSVQEQALKLKTNQETPDPPEALASIPNLTIDDLDKNVRTIPIAVSEHNGSNILFHDIFTNGIVYLDLGFDLHNLPQDILPYVTLFGRALLEMGTETQDFVKLSQRIGRTTGGIRANSFVSAVRTKDQSVAKLLLRGKATVLQSEDLLGVIQVILLTVKLDNRERFKQIVLEEKADQEAGLIPSGHRVINSRLRSYFDEAGWLSEQIGGLNYLFFLRKLVEDIDHDWSSVVKNLEKMRKTLISRNNLIINITVDGENWKKLHKNLTDFIDQLPSEIIPESIWSPEYQTSDEGLAIPAQVNYVGKGANLYQLGYELNGSVNVIKNFLGATYIWDRVRVQGGAYGGFSVFDPRSGVFTYLSYRDPNLLETIENYDGAADFLQNLGPDRLNAEELTKSIVGAIGEMDNYQLPDAKGYTSMLRFLLGESDEYRQKIRNEILSTSIESFQSFGKILAEIVNSGRIVVLGNQSKLEEANTIKKDLLTIKKVL